MSAVIIRVLRLTRSTIAPATGPNRIAGSVRASMTPAIAYAPASPPLLATSAVTATNPTQSPNELTVCAASSLEKAGWVMRSLKVAGRVPRRAATSSAKADTYSSAAATRARSAAVSVSSGDVAPLPIGGLTVVRFFVLVRFAAVRLAAVRLAVVRLAVVFFFAFFAPALAAARAARAADFAALASASASASPCFVTSKPSSSSAPHPQQRRLFGRRIKSEPHSGHGWSGTGGWLTTKSQSGYRSHPYISPNLVRLSTISPCLHWGQVTPVDFGGSFLMYLQSGYPEQPTNGPKRPNLRCSGRPHSGQVSSSISGSGRSWPSRLRMYLQPPSSSANRVHPMKKPYRPRRFCNRPGGVRPSSMQRGQSSSSSST